MPDNYDLFEADDNRKEKWLAKRPVCSICKEHIQTEKAIYYNDQWCCTGRECYRDFFENIMEDFLEDVDG